MKYFAWVENAVQALYAYSLILEIESKLTDLQDS